MNHEHDLIRFSNLTSSQFEELCYDLLRQIGFQKMIWRQGGADNGRDIEGYWVSSHPILGLQEDKWFFECKNHSNGIDPDDISSKFAWADSEDIFALVIVVSSYLTNNCRTWIEKRVKGSKYKVHVIENKQLIELLNNNQNLILKYFDSPLRALALSIQTNWKLYGEMPNPSAIYRLLISESKVTDMAILGLLWNMIYLYRSKIEDWCNDNDDIPLDWIFERLKNGANETSSILDKFQLEELNANHMVVHSQTIYPEFYAAELHIKSHNFEGIGIYSIIRKDADSGLEVLIINDSNNTAKIRYHTVSVDDVLNEIITNNRKKRIG